MRVLCSVLLLALVSVQLAAATSFTTCDSSKAYPLQVSFVGASPSTLVKGQEASIVVTGQLTASVISAKYSLIVQYMGINVFSTEGDLCSDDSKFSCPAMSGPVAISKKVTIPSSAPAGPYTVILSAVDSQGQDLLCVQTSVEVTGIRMAIDDNLIASINSRSDSTWTAGRNKFFESWTLDQAKKLMGARKTDRSRLATMTYPQAVIDALPTTFDARTQWPGQIGPITNQGTCGSCWAVAATEAISDRTAIAHKKLFEQLSAVDLLSCDGNDDGCEGGDPGSAWTYVQNNGLVSDACSPYGTWENPPGPIGTCQPSQQPCLNFQNTPNCVQQCVTNNLTWSSDLHYVSSVYGVNGVSQIQAEIMTYGPVEAAFTVYSDFVNYKSGVYQQTSNDALGGHAVKIIGWGEENGLPYWLVANSWTTYWGDQGFFKILRGQDECGIEDDIVAGQI